MDSQKTLGDEAFLTTLPLFYHHLKQKQKERIFFGHKIDLSDSGN